MTARRGRKPIAEGGTQPHVGTCQCGARVIHHRAIGRTVVLDFEPVDEGRFFIFQGCAIPDPAPANLPVGSALRNEHVCPESAPRAETP